MTPRLASVLLALVLATGCSGDIDVPQTGNVVVMHVEPGVDVIVEDTRLVFPAAGNTDLLTRIPGDVIVSDRGTGFLRRIVSVSLEGDSIVVMTDTPDLGELVKDGRVRQELSAKAGKTDGQAGAFAGMDVQFSGFERLKNDVDFKVDLVGGHFQFAPDLEIDAIIQHGRLDNFRVVAAGALDSHLLADIEVAGKIHKDIHKKLWSQKHVSVQLLGEIPVVEVVELSVGIGLIVEAEGNGKIRLSGKASGTLTGGAEFVRPAGQEEGEWRPVTEQELVFTPDLELLDGNAKFSIAATVFSQIEVRFYDAVGPVLRIAPYVELSHDTGSVDWIPAVGLRTDFEAIVKIPFVHDRYWKPYRAQLFDLKKVFDPIQFGGQSTPGPGCGDVTENGFCTEGISIRCDRGTLKITDCATQGLGCNVDADNRATCVTGCGQLDYHGACADGSLRWCEDGLVRTYECPADGPGCGYVDDVIGYNCL
jgi:hypothetical protein